MDTWTTLLARTFCIQDTKDQSSHLGGIGPRRTQSSALLPTVSTVSLTIDSRPRRPPPRACGHPCSCTFSFPSSSQVDGVGFPGREAACSPRKLMSPPRSGAGRWSLAVPLPPSRRGAWVVPTSGARFPQRRHRCRSRPPQRRIRARCHPALPTQMGRGTYNGVGQALRRLNFPVLDPVYHVTGHVL